MATFGSPAALLDEIEFLMGAACRFSRLTVLRVERCRRALDRRKVELALLPSRQEMRALEFSNRSWCRCRRWQRRGKDEACDLARAIDASNIDQHPRWSKLPDDLINVILDILQMERSARAATFGPCRFGYPGRLGQSVVSYQYRYRCRSLWRNGS